MCLKSMVICSIVLCVYLVCEKGLTKPLCSQVSFLGTIVVLRSEDEAATACASAGILAPGGRGAAAIVGLRLWAAVRQRHR